MARLKLLILIIFFSCLGSKDSNLIVQKNDTINNVLIKNRVLDRGSIKYNNNYIFYTICFSENTANKKNDKIYLDEINPPFILYKYDYDENFYIIKDNDTMIFKLRYLE
jgi:hypothetical protein